MAKKEAKNEIDNKTKGNFSKMVWVLIIITFLLFSKTIFYGFVLDDIAVIEQNKFVKQGIYGIYDILTSFYWQGYWDSNSGLYRPTSLILFAIEWQLMPNNPAIHHFFNLFWYIISIVVLYKVLQYYFANFSPWMVFFITLLFAVHPIHTEVVANIKSRDEILCFLFFVLTIYCILIKQSKLNFIFGILSYALCLLSKEAGLLFLPIIIFLIWYQYKNLKHRFYLALPLIILSVVWLFWHQYVIDSSPFKKIVYSYQDNSLLACNDQLTRFCTGVSILGRYILNAFLPYGLSYDYSFNQIPCVGLLSFEFLGSLILIFVLLYICFYFRKKVPQISFGILFFFITIFLAANIFTLIGTTMGDRLLFSPVLGLIISFILFLNFIKKPIQLENISSPFVLTLGAISMVFFGVTYNRNKVWESNYTLFTSDVLQSSNSARVHFNHATAYFSELPEDFSDQQSQLPEIIEMYQKGLKIDPKDKGALTNLGVCYYRIKDYEKSIVFTQKAIKESSKEDLSLFGNLADAYFMNGQNDQAIELYQKLIEHKKTEFNTFNFCGVAFFNKKDYQKAIEVFEMGLKNQPDHSEMYLNYGNVLAITGQYKTAIVAFEKSYEINPQQKNTLKFLSFAYLALGDQQKANYYKNEFEKK